MSNEFVSVQLPARFVSAGQCVARDGWAHPARLLDSTVLIVVKSGCFGLRVNRAEYRPRARQAVLLPAGLPHQGFHFDGEAAPEYYWAHFENGGAVAGSRVRFDALVLDLTEDAYSRLVIGFHQLISESRQARRRGDICDYLLSILLLELQQGSGEAPRNAVASRMLEYIRLHCFEKLTLNDLAHALGYTEDYLSRLFHESVHCSFRQYLHRLRMARAKRELLGSVKPITQIAAECGYGNPKFFSAAFMKCEGLSPSAYRNMFSGQHQNVD